MIDALNLFLADRGIYILVFALFILGIYGMITSKNYMKKMMCMNIMQVAVILFFLCLAQKSGATIPILSEGKTDASDYINPLPHALMLTAIVVSLGTTGVSLALLMRLKETYGSVEEDVILENRRIKHDGSLENIKQESRPEQSECEDKCSDFDGGHR